MFVRGGNSRLAVFNYSFVKIVNIIKFRTSPASSAVTQCCDGCASRTEPVAHNMFQFQNFLINNNILYFISNNKWARTIVIKIFRFFSTLYRTDIIIYDYY